MTILDCTVTRTSRDPTIFPFLDLPIELRLKIYAQVLPPRTHQIATHQPRNGAYYAPTPSTVLRSLFSQTMYPSLCPPSTMHGQNLTTYVLLNANFRLDFPNPTIDPALLRVCKQIHAEAEPVLYGHRETRWDFGVHVEAVLPFWADRSEVARRCVRSLHVAREIPSWTVEDLKDGAEREEGAVRDEVWATLCKSLQTGFSALRCVDLTVWGEGGAAGELPLAGKKRDGALEEESETEEEKEDEEEQQETRWREWEWTRALLSHQRLEELRVRWWGFERGEGEMHNKFDGWLGRRMIADDRVRQGILAAGYVTEGLVVLRSR